MLDLHAVGAPEGGSVEDWCIEERVAAAVEHCGLRWGLPELEITQSRS